MCNELIIETPENELTWVGKEKECWGLISTFIDDDTLWINGKELNCFLDAVVYERLPAEITFKPKYFPEEVTLQAYLRTDDIESKIFKVELEYKGYYLHMPGCDWIFEPEAEIWDKEKQEFTYYGPIICEKIRSFITSKAEAEKIAKILEAEMLMWSGLLYEVKPVNVEIIPAIKTEKIERGVWKLKLESDLDVPLESYIDGFGICEVIAHHYEDKNKFIVKKDGEYFLVHL